jgi:hypothetical protein
VALDHPDIGRLEMAGDSVLSNSGVVSRLAARRARYEPSRAGSKASLSARASYSPALAGSVGEAPEGNCG